MGLADSDRDWMREKERERKGRLVNVSKRRENWMNWYVSGERGLAREGGPFASCTFLNDFINRISFSANKDEETEVEE